jgi:hypothetical protein
MDIHFEKDMALFNNGMHHTYIFCEHLGTTTYTHSPTIGLPLSCKYFAAFISAMSSKRRSSKQLKMLRIRSKTST